MGGERQGAGGGGGEAGGGGGGINIIPNVWHVLRRNSFCNSASVPCKMSLTLNTCTIEP